MSSEYKYIHGYNSKEQERLLYQNSFLSQFIYKNIDLKAVSNLLEVGCGVGAQMQYVFDKYDQINIAGIDISEKQLKQAGINLSNQGISKDRYELIQADVMQELKLNNKFDSLLMVWVLEHIKDPIPFLKNALSNLELGASVFITEVFDSSFYIYPDCPKMLRYWENSMRLKTEISGDADVGIKLYDLLSKAGLKDIEVKPFIIHLDNSDSAKRNQMFDYWESLLESGLEELISNNLCTESFWKEVQEEIKMLKNHSDAVFYYSFVQAFARV